MTITTDGSVQNVLGERWKFNEKPCKTIFVKKDACRK